MDLGPGKYLVRGHHENWEIYQTLQHMALSHDARAPLGFAESARMRVLEMEHERRNHPNRPSVTRPANRDIISKELSQIINRTGRPVAQPTYKHSKAGFGTESTLTTEQAQMLLDTSYHHKKARYAFDDTTGTVYLFRESGTGTDVWHPYPLHSDKSHLTKQLKTFFAELFRSGRTSRSEHNLLIKGYNIKRNR